MSQLHVTVLSTVTSFTFSTPRSLTFTDALRERVIAKRSR